MFLRNKVHSEVDAISGFRSYRFFIMALNNAYNYKICRVLHHEQQHQQDENKSYSLKKLFMNDAVEELT